MMATPSASLTAVTLNRTAGVAWSVAARALPGQAVSGDLHVVTSWGDGVLIGVVDGLGHGEEAAAAARVAVEVLQRHAGEPVIALVQLCHRALLETRGVVMTLLSVDLRNDSMTAIGVGNVEATLRRADPRTKPSRESVLLRNGVVGYQLPALQFDRLPIAPGDTVVLATDGMREDFVDLVDLGEPVPELVSRIMAEKFRGTDDGLVLAFNYVGKT